MKTINWNQFLELWNNNKFPQTEGFSVTFDYFDYEEYFWSEYTWQHKDDFKDPYTCVIVFDKNGKEIKGEDLNRNKYGNSIWIKDENGGWVVNKDKDKKIEDKVFIFKIEQEIDPPIMCSFLEC